jgi:hypothetical protein
MRMRVEKLEQGFTSPERHIKNGVPVSQNAAINFGDYSKWP